MCTINFKNSFVSSVKDKVLDKNELLQLNELAKNPKIKDKELAKYLINDLNRYKDTTNLIYNLGGPMGKVEQISFLLTPAYSENEKIPGKNILEIVSNISQTDTLTETDGEGSRCVAGSTLNAYLLLGGSFDSIASKFDVDKELTYKNVHLVQEKIYDMANLDNQPGLAMGDSYSYNPATGKISGIEYNGEIKDALQKIGIEAKPLLGENINSINDRSKAVNEFMKSNPNGVLQVGVYMDTSTGNLHSPSDTKVQNHAVLIFKRNDKYYLADTGTNTNGAGKSLTEISKENFAGFAQYTSGTVHGLKMKQ